MPDQLLTFKETSIFSKQIDAHSNKHDLLFAIQRDLLNDPTRGAVIAGTNGARKSRVADTKSGRGKSGSFRYIYVYFVSDSLIYLLFFYPKNVQENLTAEQKKRVSELIAAAKENLERKKR